MNDHVHKWWALTRPVPGTKKTVGNTTSVDAETYGKTCLCGASEIFDEPIPAKPWRASPEYDDALATMRADK